MVAYHFPPLGQSTGRLRTLSFVRHLDKFGWRPHVLTAREHAYPLVQPETLPEIPSTVQVSRAPGVDVSRVASIRGVYPRWLATPDRWNTWAIGAAVSGMDLVREQKPSVIWATFPVCSAIVAGTLLSRRSGIPLIVDLRDPMVYEEWPRSRPERAIYGRIERWAVNTASAVVVTTPGARALYRERFANLDPARFQLIANAVEDFDAPGPDDITDVRSDDGPITLVHSGLLELPDRDPSGFFRAIASMRQKNALPARGLRVILRATGNDQEIQRLAAQFEVEDIIDVEPYIARSEALAEMSGASALLLFQGRQCNRQIPAKAYEYLAMCRPIIALVDPGGDTQELVVGRWGVPYAADMASPTEIEQSLGRFFSDINKGRPFIPPPELLARHSRTERTRELAALLDVVADGRLPGREL